jgi:hypothetical protein
MSAKTPSVSNDYLFDPAQPGRSIPLETPAWRAWLEAPTTTRFAYPLFNPQAGYIHGVMTVRKERRQRGGVYWSVYRRGQGTVHRIYLGPSAALTRTRLAEVAATLLARASAEASTAASAPSLTHPSRLP